MFFHFIHVYKWHKSSLFYLQMCFPTIHTKLLKIIKSLQTSMVVHVVVVSFCWDKSMLLNVKYPCCTHCYLSSFISVHDKFSCQLCRPSLFVKSKHSWICTCRTNFACCLLIFVKKWYLIRHTKSLTLA